MSRKPREPRRSKKSAASPAKKEARKATLRVSLCAVFCLAALYFLFLSPVSAASEALPLTDIEPERLQKYLGAQERYQLPWYVFAGIDYAELGERPPVPSDGRVASIAARVSGTKQGNVSVAHDESEFEYATLKKILERYPRQDNAFITRAVDRMRQLSRLSKALGSYGFPLETQNCDYSDQMDLHSGEVPGHIGVAIYAPAGTQVVSSSGGTLAACGWEEASGNTVSVLGGDGVKLTYAHLGAIEPGLVAGMTVQKGAPLGTMEGASDEAERISFTPHLLFCVEDGSFVVNPKIFLDWWRK